MIDVVGDQIVIHNLPEEVESALRRLAASRGTSVEAEARSILVGAVMREDIVLAWLDGMAMLSEGDPLPVPERRSGREPVRLDAMLCPWE